MNKQNINLELYDITGKLVQTAVIYQGTTIAYFDTKTLYAGEYIVKIYNASGMVNKK